ncbi:hypothetical protein KJ359_009227 [Pestalotiopsis sp. 9143b]|nr:hypothetical protein KJ359_009227 [Pestalotiopsis sp. 9143b]
MTAAHDAQRPPVEDDFDFSEFINWPEETAEPDVSMTDQPSISTGFDNEAQNAADAFNANASTFFDEAIFGMPDPADFSAPVSAPVSGQNSEYSGSQDTAPVNTQQGPAAGAQVPDEYGELRHLLTATSGPVPDYLEPGAGANLPIDITAETPRPEDSRQAPGANLPVDLTADTPSPEAELPTAPVAEIPGQGNDTVNAVIPADLPAPRAQSAFPKLDRSITERQSGMPLGAPQGCTEAARSGWDYRGWWYQGKHDSCPIPTAHRHERTGQVSFNGLSDVLELVAKVMVRK